MFQQFFRTAIFCGLFACAAPLVAQTESGNPEAPLDDITFRTSLADHRVLPYQPIREADIMWEKRIWRIIDVREKLNHPFADAKMPFFKIMKDGIEAGNLMAYSVENDKFTSPLGAEQIQSLLYSTDTVSIFDVQTGEEVLQAVSNVIDETDVQRFRVKEVWYFDKNLGQLKCRILGIAPLISVFDKTTGDFRYEKPLFWVHYPSIRENLARFQVFNAGNDASPMSWEDVFEMRQFASTIYKESNVADRKIEEYATGRDQLLTGQKIASEIFNFEHDLWSW